VDRRAFLRAAGAVGGAAALGLGADRAAAEERPAAGAPWVRTGPPPGDVIVVGAGAFGLWTSLYLARMGARVTLVDQYGPGNSRSTSGGETRGVRTSYGDRAHGLSWVRWADESIRRWKAFDAEWQERLLPRLFFTTGDLILREEMEPYLQDTQKHWDEVGVQYEILDADEVSRRWPVIHPGEAKIGFYEVNAGVVRARRACEAVATVAREEGVELRIARARPGGWTDSQLWDVELDGGERVRADQYVFAVGPWFPKLFPGLMDSRLRIPMGEVVYFATPPADHRFSYPNLPSYGVPGCTGWPALPMDNRGFRVRTGGRPAMDPDESPRRLDMEDVERPRQILQRWFPELAGAPVSETRACHYELSVTRNFIIDHHPDWGNAWLVGGGCAEAFKFGPVSGEYVAKRIAGDPTDPELDEGFRLSDETFEG
jgi:glycine/D-amino acid oxidase-like deaminating enzyme